jgi:outer membrane protein OmpA-like peptidoglycan-associated protein
MSVYKDEDEGTRTAFAVLIPLLLLLIAFVIGFGVHQAHKRPKAAVPAVVPAAAAAVQAAPSGAQVLGAAEDEARVVVDNGVVKFYFASGKAEVAATAATVLPDVLKAAAGKTVVLSGYHDTSGDPALNAALSKQRAEAVRDLLVAAGVPAASIELKKPEQMTGTGTAAEARRVELLVK